MLNINPKKDLVLFYIQLHVSSERDKKSTGLAIIPNAKLNNDINGHAYSKHLGFNSTISIQEAYIYLNTELYHLLLIRMGDKENCSTVVVAVVVIILVIHFKVFFNLNFNNYLPLKILTSSQPGVRAVLRNIGPGSWRCKPSAARSVQKRLRANIPQYGLNKLC